MKKEATLNTVVVYSIVEDDSGIYAPNDFISEQHVQEKLKNLDAILSLLHKVVDTLNRFATIMENASTKATDKGVLSAGHISASHAEGEKNTNQATKDADNANLKQQPTTKTPSLTSSFQYPLFYTRFATIMENASIKATDKGVPSAGHASASHAEGEKNINQATKDADNVNLNQQPKTKTPSPTSSFQYPLFPKSKGKQVMSTKDVEDEETESNSKDEYTNSAETMTESSKKKKLKKFSVVIEGGEQIHRTAKKIEEQKRIKESLKVELAKQEVEKVKSELVDLMGIDEGSTSLSKKKGKRMEDHLWADKTRMEYLDHTKKELKIDFNRPLKEQDPLDELNDLANNKRKRADNLKDHSMSTKKHKSSAQHKKECASTIETLSSSSNYDSDTYPNEDTLTIKAKYRDDLIAFHIPPSSATLAALKKESGCDFSKDSRIGDGGFGVVHMGRLSDRWQNHEDAIKRLDNTDHQGKKEFLNELRLISRFHHQSIISFIGYCDEGDEIILVYEYARNGSLDHHLQDQNKRH
nr:probable receptor-like protein kinase At5g59700 [Tanacetum cinerariifolium]